MKLKYKVMIPLLSLIIMIIGGYLAYSIIFPDVVKFNPTPNMVLGVDLSSHNGEVDFDALEKNNVKFVFMKATEGSSFVDKNFISNYEKARATEIKVGVYHFFRFDINGILQAKHLINNIYDKRLDLPIIIDVEEFGNPQVNQMVVINRLEKMVSYLKKYNYQIALYSNYKGYKKYIKTEFSDLPLWICRFSAPEPHLDWTFWQFTHKGRIEGVEGDVDLNLFKGSHSDFELYLNNFLLGENIDNTLVGDSLNNEVVKK